MSAMRDCADREGTGWRSSRTRGDSRSGCNSLHPKFHHNLMIFLIIHQMNILISLINPVNDNGSDT